MGGTISMFSLSTELPNNLNFVQMEPRLEAGSAATAPSQPLLRSTLIQFLVAIVIQVFVWWRPISQYVLHQYNLLYS